MRQVVIKLPMHQVAALSEIAVARGDSFDEVVQIACGAAINHSQDSYGVELPAVFRSGRREIEQIPGMITNIKCKNCMHGMPSKYAPSRQYRADEIALGEILECICFGQLRAANLARNCEEFIDSTCEGVKS